MTAPDTPGFPVTISAAGSYRLTGNLFQSDPQVDVIEITSEGVTLDLGGFAITGSVVCAGTPVSDCVPSNAAGRAIDGAVTARTAVRNGAVRGTGQGIVLGSTCLIEDVRVSEVTVNGIRCGARGSIVRGSSVVRTGLTGIVVDGGVVDHSTSEGNGGNGIQVLEGSTVDTCTSRDNGFSGIVLSGAGSVTDSVASGNVSDGIIGASGSTITRCTTSSNGQDGIDTGLGSTVAQCTAFMNTGDGFEVGIGSTVVGSTARGNTGFGLAAASGSGYGQNVFDGNNGNLEAQVNAVGGALFQLGTNVCQGDTTCP